MKQRSTTARTYGAAWLRQLALWMLKLIAAWLLAITALLIAYRWVEPPLTTVQLQRILEATWRGQAVRFERTPVPLERISPHLRHAVIAAEDSRFYQHHGIDWTELQIVLEEELPDGRIRGASTISQQLVKNLFLTTHRCWLRKLAEFPLAVLAEVILGKRRILELYLNVVEWGPGIYGAEAAARYHYGLSSARLTREQAARLAAILPNPRRRRPERMTHYAGIILRRMELLGW